MIKLKEKEKASISSSNHSLKAIVKIDLSESRASKKRSTSETLKTEGKKFSPIHDLSLNFFYFFFKKQEVLGEHNSWENFTNLYLFFK